MAGAMSLLLYLTVLAVSVTSVLFGLDWLSSPPQPPARHPVQVASTQSLAKPPAIKPAEKKPLKNSAVTPVVAKPAPVPATAPVAAGNNVAPPGPTAVASADSADDAKTPALDSDATSSIAPSGSAASQAPRCDVQACEAAYRSFRASDCTWQPYDGPRRFCDKGTPPAAPAKQAAATAESSLARAQAQAPSCNVQACGRAYLSFDETDCTYQPYAGPRQLCAK